MLDDDSELHAITPADSDRQQAEAQLSGDWLPAVIRYASSLLPTEEAEDGAAVTGVLELLESLLDWWPALTLPVCRAAAFLPFVYSRLQATQPDRADAHSLSASASLTQSGRRRRLSCADSSAALCYQRLPLPAVHLPAASGSGERAASAVRR